MLTEDEQKNISTSITSADDSVKSDLQSENTKENTDTPPLTDTNLEKKENFWFELLKIVFLAIIIVVPIRTFVSHNKVFTTSKSF